MPWVARDGAEAPHGDVLESIGLVKDRGRRQEVEGALQGRGGRGRGTQHTSGLHLR